MDDHARRVCAPLKDGWTDFEAGRATLLDLSRLAEQAAGALDNSNAPLPRLLATTASDLESAYFTNERETHQEVGRRILAPVMTEIERQA